MRRTEKKAWLGLGSNQGDAEAHFRYALTALGASCCRISAVSALYRTPAWGKTDQPGFINACAALETELAPYALLELCLEIERRRGRARAEKWGPRSLDIDILFYENYRSPPGDAKLIVPHPLICERAFAVLPLAEISPELPLQGKTAAQWARTLRASGAAEGIKKLKPAALWAGGQEGAAAS